MGAAVLAVGLATVAACSGAQAVKAAPATRASSSTPTGNGRPALTAIGDTLYLGWTSSTGTNAAGALSLGRSTDGGRTITKITNIGSTTPGEGPALDNDGRAVFLAWTDAAHTLNLAYYNGTSVTCETTLTAATSPYSPALANDGSGTRYLAWADERGHLNVAKVNDAACSAAGTMTLTDRNTLPDTTIAGPALAYDTTSAGLGLVMAWAGADSAHTLNIASYVNAAALAHKARLAANSPDASTSAPGLASAAADLYLGFRGPDGKLYIAYSEGCVPSCFSSHTDGTPIGSGVGMSGGRRTWVSYFDSTGALVVNSF